LETKTCFRIAVQDIQDGDYGVKFLKIEENPLVYSVVPTLMLKLTTLKHVIEIPEKVSCAKGGNSMSVFVDSSKSIPEVDIVVEFYLV